MSARSTYRFLERLAADARFAGLLAEGPLTFDAWRATALQHGFQLDAEELKRVVEEVLERTLDPNHWVAEIHAALEHPAPEPTRA